MGVGNENDILEVQNWLKTQYHLPQNIGNFMS